MEDAELVLRFFALRHVDQYTRGMQGFLDLYMLRASKFDLATIDELRIEFNQTIEIASAIYGDDLFRPYDLKNNCWSSRPQKAVYDAVMVAISRNIDIRERILDRRIELKKATIDLFKLSEEGTFTGRGNTKADNQNRINLIDQMIKKIAG